MHLPFLNSTYPGLVTSTNALSTTNPGGPSQCLQAGQELPLPHQQALPLHQRLDLGHHPQKTQPALGLLSLLGPEEISPSLLPWWRLQ